MKKLLMMASLIWLFNPTMAQKLAPIPPMGWMTWNAFGVNINEQLIRDIADSMLSTGMVSSGYQYIMIDDGWVGGRDNRNNIIPDPNKFPSGIKALADFVHQRGIKLGIYSDASPLTCESLTASLNFEEQDAKTFAAWGIDYLKYDYCHAPSDSNTAKLRYRKMADALRASGRDIVFGICEWGERKPWNWAYQAGGQLWRTTADVRDKWKKKPSEAWGDGIMDIYDINVRLNAYAGPSRWNDPDMLIVGLYGRKGPSSGGGGKGCSDTEYQTQMTLWSMMAAPLIATNDVRNMTAATKLILMNPEVIAVNQDSLGIQAERQLMRDSVDYLIKPLQNGDRALAILNRDAAPKNLLITLDDLGLSGKYEIRDLWAHRAAGKGKTWNGTLLGHETKLLRLKPIK